MKRFRRWPAGGLVGISLLLCIATTALWVRGFRIRDQFYWISTGSRCTVFVDSSQGMLAFGLDAKLSGPGYIRSGFHHDTGPPVFDYLFTGNPVYVSRHRFGFMLSSYRNRWTLSSSVAVVCLDQSIGLPCWFVLFTTMAGAAWLLIRCRRGLNEPGHCMRCGYDLRATPDRCPECGHVPPKAEMIPN